jgi:hypothetical protein
MPPEKSVDSMAVEITHLQQGQVRIESSIDKLSDKLDGVGQALTSLIRLTEKHDALADRVKILESESSDRAEVAHRGEAYMNATKYLLPLALGVIVSMVGWLVSRVDNHDSQIHQLEVNHAENH